MNLEVFETLIAKHPDKMHFLEKIKLALSYIENPVITADCAKEIAQALEEKDEKKLVLIENMVRRMHLMKREEASFEVVKPTLPIARILGITALLALVFYSIKEYFF